MNKVRRKCSVCKEYYEPKSVSTEPCPKFDCRMVLTRKILAKREEKRGRESNIEKRKKKDELKSKSQWENDLQTEINLIVKHIDKGWPCISSGNLTGKRNAGHLWSVGSNRTIRFHLLNIFNQSEYDNGNRGGAPLEYMQGIKNTFGNELWEEIESLKAHPPIKQTIPEIREKISIARGVVKELARADKLYSLEERIYLRREINKRIGIYQ